MQQKEMIVAMRNAGMSYTDIARFAGVTETNARNIYSRAIRKTTVNSEGTCRFCGLPLTYTDGAKKKQFCSDKCRFSWHNQQSMKRPYIRTCEQCGVEFVSIGYPKKRYCSRNCRTLAEREGKRHE